MAENTEQREIVKDLNIKDGKNQWGKRNNTICTIPRFQERKSEKQRGMHMRETQKEERERKSYLESEDGEQIEPNLIRREEKNGEQ